MSKTTKIIAALGVVAGLGVAALPAFTYATTETVSGSVEVDIEVESAIAITIEGNNDEEDIVPFGDEREVEYTAVTPEAGDDPSEEGWYEIIGGDGEETPFTYGPTSDDTVQSGKTYYIKSSRTTYNDVDAFSPSGASSSVIDIHPTPAASINALSSSAFKLLPNSAVDGNDDNEFRSVINVYTNASDGYTLSIKDADSTLDLTNEGGATIPAGEIESSATTFDLVAGEAAWGYKVNTASADGTGYSAITASDVTIKTHNAPTDETANRQTIVYYGAATAPDQATGIYRDIIVYTATTGNGS